MHQHRRQNVDGGIDWQSPEVSFWQEGKNVGGAAPAWMQEVTGQMSAEVTVPATLQARKL